MTARLRREVIVPVPAYRRPSSLLGLCVAVVLVGSFDAALWTYRAAEAEAESAVSAAQAAALRIQLEANQERLEQLLHDRDRVVAGTPADQRLGLDRDVCESVGRRHGPFYGDPSFHCDPNDPLCCVD